MKFLLLLTILTLIVPFSVIAEETPAGYYNLLFDDDGYVIDLTAWDTALPYEKHFINQPLPQDVLNGYYKFNRDTGLFEKDESKYQEYLKEKESHDD